MFHIFTSPYLSIHTATALRSPYTPIHEKLQIPPLLIPHLLPKRCLTPHPHSARLQATRQTTRPRATRPRATRLQAPRSLVPPHLIRLPQPLVYTHGSSYPLPQALCFLPLLVSNLLHRASGLPPLRIQNSGLRD